MTKTITEGAQMLNEYCFDNYYIRHAIDEEPDGSRYSMHIHEQCEIYLFVSGDVEYVVEGVRYPLNENTLMLMRPAEAHVARILGQGVYERYALNFPLSFAADIDPKGKLMHAFTQRPLGKNNKVTLPIEDQKLVRRLFEKMSAKADDYDRRLNILTNLYTLLSVVNDAFDQRQNDADRPAEIEEKMVAYVNGHIFEELSVPEMAEYFYLSPSQFSRIFKHATGAPPWGYVTIKRLTKAKEGIRSGLPIRKVAADCGFKDYTSFYRAFKKHFGCSPADA